LPFLKIIDVKLFMNVSHLYFSTAALLSTSDTVPSEATNLSIGQADIRQETIDNALEAVKNELEQLLGESTQESNHKEIPRGCLLIPEDSDPGERRFKAILTYRINELSSSNLFESLLLELSQCIKKLGHECYIIDVRVEKGFVASAEDHWHHDGYGLGHGFSICYGTNRNWSTRIVNTNIHKEFSRIQDARIERISQEVIQRIEEKSELSLHGHFYNVQEVLHRAPIIEDLGGKISADELRVFMRFRQRLSKAF
jgi:hypothetical protein